MHPDTSPSLSTPNKTKIQQIIGCLLYYARALDNTMLVALNTIAQSQSNPTQHTAKLCHQLLDYCATYPNAELRCHKNEMILHINSDTSYFVAPYVKRRISGYFFSHQIVQNQHDIMLQFILNVVLSRHQLGVKPL